MEYYQSSLKDCAFPEEREKRNTAIYWLVANEDGTVIVLEKGIANIV